jgi:NADH dehydrogenase
MTEPEAVRRAVDGCDVVVHLVAIRQGRPEEFQRVMEEGTRDLVAAAREAGVRRFVLMSALGTSEETKDLVPYYHAKWEQEQTLRGSGIEHVIFRPSFVFARDGGILPTFRKLARLAPVTPDHRVGRAAHPADLDRGRRRLLRAGGRPSRRGQPRVRARRSRHRQLDEFWERLKKALGMRRPSLHVPVGLMRVNALLTERLPGNIPLTRDLLTMLEHGDNVVSNDEAVQVFGLPLVPLDEQLRRAV